MNNNNNKLGEFIKNFRQEHNLSLRQFGSISGISHTHIDSIERGIDPRTGKPVRLTNDLIERIATATRSEPTYVFSLSMNEDVDETAYIVDDDIRMIQRARMKMSEADREKMMKILKLSFDDVFED